MIGCLCATVAQANVLLIIADDLGMDSLSVFNSDPAASCASTPTIDNLYSNGVAFARYYAYSTCSPTRASIMTGRYSFRTGVVSPEIGDYNLPSNEFTLPEALIESGVITNGYSTYATTDNVNESIDWISRQGTNSWFLWLAFNAPHIPHHRPPNDLHDYLNITDDEFNGLLRHYKAMVQAMDTEMGRLLTNVNFSTTTVIFIGDNGTLDNVIQDPFPSKHGKGFVYEGGIRVPMIITGAAVSNSLVGTTNDTLLHSIDLYSTILDLFGTSAEELVPDELVLDSCSFAPILRGERYTCGTGDIMVRNQTGTRTTGMIEGDYKYILCDTGTQELYNVAVDLPEATNLLSGTLTAAEQAALDNLKARLTTYVNVPQIQTAGFDANNQFCAEIGWFDNDGFTLWRTEDLVSNAWMFVQVLLM